MNNETPKNGLGLLIKGSLGKFLIYVTWSSPPKDAITAFIDLSSNAEINLLLFPPH